MASNENILTKTQDWLTGNVNGPQLRDLARQRQLLEAQAATRKAEQLLERARKPVPQLSPLEERLQLDQARQASELSQVPISAAQDKQKLATRAEVDSLDIGRTQAMEGIETENEIRRTDNQYANISGLLGQSMKNEAAARDAFIADNDALRTWIAEQSALNRDFADKKMQPGFLDYLGQTAQALAPFVALAAVA